MNTEADQLGFEIAGSQSSNSDVNTDVLAAKRLADKAEEVALLYKGLEIYVRKIELAPEGFLIGQIADFSNVCSTQYEGLRLGQPLSFRHQHVQHISKHAEK